MSNAYEIHSTPYQPWDFYPRGQYGESNGLHRNGGVREHRQNGCNGCPESEPNNGTDESSPKYYIHKSDGKPQYANGIERFLNEGPIVQEIPDSLMVGDYIEIHGICRGQEVIVQLLSRSDPTALPLHITMSAGGPVLVKSQTKEKVDRQERNVRMSLQQNLDFVLCIYAMEDGYEIKLNQNTVCFQKHLLKLEDVSAISMDGDADFTSIEFKDIYGDGEEENPYAPEDTGQGFMRVQELRESFSRHPGSPMIVRSSTRKSNRSERDANLNKTNWPTSNDLSRAEYDVDPVREASSKTTPILQNDVVPVVAATPEIYAPSPKSKSRFSWKPGSRKSLTVEENKYMAESAAANRVLAGETHAGVYKTAEDGYGSGSLGNLNASSASLADKSKKKRTSLFGKMRKSKGSETDVSVEGTEKTKRKGLKNPFKSRKSVNVAPLGDTRQSYSMPDVTRVGSSTYSRLSTDLDQSRLLGTGVEPIPVAGPIPKTIQKSPAAEMAAYVVAQKAVPEFENFSLTNRDFRELPALATATMGSSQRTSVQSLSQGRKLKGTAPEIADTLLDTERAGFDQSTSLTSNQPFEPLPVYTRQSLFSKSDASLGGHKKLKGPAPEVAAVIDDTRYPADTALTHENVVQGDFVASSRMSTIPSDPKIKSSDIKLKGPAPEVAASLFERHSNALNRMPDTTFTGDLAQSRQTFPIIDRPNIDQDPVRIHDSQYQSRPVYANRPQSATHRRHSNAESDVSSVHSDGEYYLEVGKSDYYFDRRRSLHNYRSRKARKPNQESMDTSARSSVSSLKYGDKVIVPKSTSSLDNRNQVNSWLNGYNREPEIHATRPNSSKVYAAAPTSKYSEPVELTMKKAELRQADNVAKLPLAMTPGRSAVLAGHFSDEDTAWGKCMIRLRPSDDDDHVDALLFELSRNGEFMVQISTTGEPYTIVEYTSKNIQSPKEYGQSFTLEYYARGLYFAVTVNGFISFIIRGSFEPSSFQIVELLPGSNAELDYFSVASELTIPITLKYPISSHRDDAQCMTLTTRMNADSKCVRMEFKTQTNNKFDVVLDFIDGYIYAEPVKTADGCMVGKETARQSIPFVPEQIRKLVVLKKNNDNNLTIYANQKEIFQQPISLPKPYGKLSEVHVSGDIQLLGAKLE